MFQNSQDAHMELKETLMLGLLGLVTLPTHLVTLRLQTQGRERAYKGIGDAFTRIAKEEGIRAFAKGGTSSLAGNLLYTPLTNAFGGVSKKAVAMLHLQKIDEVEELTPQGVLESNTAALFVSTILTIPENITAKLQFQRGALGQGVYRGPLDCISKVFKREGVAGLFRGWSSVLLRDLAIHSALAGGYLASKPVIERILRPYETAETPFIVSGVSFTMGMAAAVAVAYPADVVKAHMQTMSATNPLTLRQGFRLVYAQHGLRGFYRGLGASAISGGVWIVGLSAFYYLTDEELN